MICCGQWGSHIKNALCWEPEYYGLVLNNQQEVTVVKKSVVTIVIPVTIGSLLSIYKLDLVSVNLPWRQRLIIYLKYWSANSQHDVKICTRNANE